MTAPDTRARPAAPDRGAAKPGPVLPGVGRWRRLGRFLAELHYRLRTEGGTPARQAAAVALGTFIGCLPLYGLHLFLCLAGARLLSLSRATTYLAAHVNNPLSAPFLLVVEYQLGRLILTGKVAPELPPATFAGLLGIGLDLAVGSVALGVPLALVLALVAGSISRLSRMPTPQRWLLEETSGRYRGAGIFDWEFVRGKLKRDPLYFGLLASGRLPESGRLLDLGTGRGILIALLLTARRAAREGHWDPAWPPAPQLEAIGIEVARPVAVVAREAVGGEARIEIADLVTYRPPRCRAVTLFDVLHYLDGKEQERLLDRVAAALEPGGSVLIREPDTSPRWRFALTRAGERLCTIARLEPTRRFHYRCAAEWSRILAERGLDPTVTPFWRRTPFSNVLIEGHRRASSDPT